MRRFLRAAAAEVISIFVLVAVILGGFAYMAVKAMGHIK